MRLGLDSEFACCNAPEVVPYFFAIELRVSPDTTTCLVVDVVAVLAGFDVLLEDVEACVAPGIVSF